MITMTKSFADKSRLGKLASRELAMMSVEGHLPVKHRAIMMPSSDAECVKKAVEMGVFYPKTEVICVERDKEVFAKMREALSPVAVRKQYFFGELSDLKIKDKIDFAFIDLIGTITRNIAGWLRHELSPNLVEMSDVTFTLNKAERNNQFIKEARSFFSTPDQQKHRKKVMEDLRASKDIVSYLQIIEYCFWEWEFDVLTAIPEYYDTTAMLLIALRNFKRKKPAPNRNQIWDAMLLETPAIAGQKPAAQKYSAATQIKLDAIERRIVYWMQQERDLGAEHRIEEKAIKSILAGFRSHKTRLIRQQRPTAARKGTNERSKEGMDNATQERSRTQA